MAKKVAKKPSKAAPVRKVKKKGVSKAEAEAKVKEEARKKAEVEVEEDIAAPKKAKAKVLSIDDEEVIRTLLKKILTKAGYGVKLAASGEEGLRVMKKEAFDLCIIDLKMPGMGGMAFLGRMKELYPDTEAVILTAFGDIDTAVDAMKKGAFNFVPKPFKKEIFLTIIGRALERRAMKREVEETRTAMREIENEASSKIGQLEDQLAAVEEAKGELGEQFNAIRESLVTGDGKRGDLEKKVISLEKVAGRIKEMEKELVAAEKEKKETFKKAEKLEKELTLKVSSNVELGNKLEEAKTSLDGLKKEVVKKKEAVSSEEKDKLKLSLGDIHKALADFRKEIED
ncbi:MAG: response regulator [Candidatus Omnitrophota bacterium]